MYEIFQNCKKNKKLRNFILTFIGSIIYNLNSTFCFINNQFIVYVLSNINHFDKTINIKKSSFIISLFFFSMSLSIPFNGLIEYIIGFKNLLGLGLILNEILIYLITNQTKINNLYIILSLLGIINGLTIISPKKNLLLFYPERKGIISSIYDAINSILYMLLCVLGERKINPNEITLNEEEEAYPYEVSKNIKKFYGFLLLALPALFIISLFLIKQNKNENIYEIENKEQIKESYQCKNTFINILYSKKMWSIILVSAFSQFLTNFVDYNNRVLISFIKFKEKFIKYMSSIYGLINIIFAPIFGFIKDKIEYYSFIKVMIFLSVIESISLLLFIQNKKIYFLSYILNIVITSGFMTNSFPYMLSIFGEKYCTEIFGLNNILNSLFSFVVNFIFSQLSKNFSTHTKLIIIYRLIIILGLFLSFVSYNLVNKNMYIDLVPLPQTEEKSENGTENEVKVINIKHDEFNKL